MKRISTILVLAMMLASVFSSSIAFAAMPPDNTASPNTIMTCARQFVAVSSTSAIAEVFAGSSGDTPFITSEITLQSAPLGTTSFTDVKGSTKTKTVENQTSILHTCSFDISSDKEYRIKVKLTDKVNGIQSTKTYYKTLDYKQPHFTAAQMTSK